MPDTDWREVPDETLDRRAAEFMGFEPFEEGGVLGWERYEDGERVEAYFPQGAYDPTEDADKALDVLETAAGRYGDGWGWQQRPDPELGDVYYAYVFGGTYHWSESRERAAVVAALKSQEEADRGA